MKCPDCNEHMGVTNTYDGELVTNYLKYISNGIAQVTNPDQLVIRRRKCPKCGVYRYSIEILDQPIKVNNMMRHTLKQKFSKD